MHYIYIYIHTYIPTHAPSACHPHSTRQFLDLRAILKMINQQVCPPIIMIIIMLLLLLLLLLLVTITMMILNNNTCSIHTSCMSCVPDIPCP